MTIAIKNRIGATDQVTGSTLSRAIRLQVSSVEDIGYGKAKYILYPNDESINLHPGMSVVVSGLTNEANNGTFKVHASGEYYLYLNNSNAVEEAEPTDSYVLFELINHGMHVVPLISISNGGSSGRVIVTDEATPIPSINFTGRKDFLIFNNSEVDIDIGWNDQIVFGNHMILPNKSSVTLALSSKVTLYGIADSGQSAEICFMEVS